MTASVGAVARVALLVVVAVLLQVSGLSQLRLFGGTADLVPLLVGAVALYAGSVPAAASGFAVGLLLELVLGRHLGVASLVLTAVGYTLGRFREVHDPGHGLAPLAFGAAATAATVLGVSLLSFMLQIDAAVSPLVLREMLATLLLNTLLALPVFVIVRRVLRGALLVDPQERRRRRREVTPTGPIGLRGLGRP